jgi:hypothetical protein
MPRTVIPPLFFWQIRFLKILSNLPIQITQTWSQELPYFFRGLSIMCYHTILSAWKTLISLEVFHLTWTLLCQSLLLCELCSSFVPTSYTGWWYAQECVWCKNVTLTILEETSLLLSCLHLDKPQFTQVYNTWRFACYLANYYSNFLAQFPESTHSLLKIPEETSVLLSSCSLSLYYVFLICNFKVSAKNLLMCVSSSNLHKNESKCYCPWLKKKYMVWWCNWETDRQIFTDRQGPEARHFYVMTLSNDVLPAFSLDIQLTSELNQDWFAPQRTSRIVMVRRQKPLTNTVMK